MLELERLEFGYSRHRRLWSDVSFALRPGEVACIIGANGTGKTTLLRCLLGLLQPLAGQVRVDQAVLGSLSSSQRARLMAYVPQAESSVFPHTVRELVLMGRTPYLGLAGRPGKADNEIAQEAMRQMGILHLADRPYDKVSGGEQQLTLLARALTQQARYLVLDEPAASLDYGNQVKLLRRVDELAGQGYGILMTSHFPDHAFLVADQVVALKDGQALVGSPRQKLTGDFLTSLYGTPVEVREIDHRGRQVQICLPLFNRDRRESFDLRSNKLSKEA